ncbi:MAG: hypothetical protein AB8H80_22300 [Planctomycetota bacterium]
MSEDDIRPADGPADGAAPGPTHQIPDLLGAGHASLQAHAMRTGLDLPPGLPSDEIAAALVTHLLAAGDAVETDGVLAILPEGFGFVRQLDSNLRASAVDAFVSPSQVRALNLRDGHRVQGPVRAPRGTERFFALTRIERVQDELPKALHAATPFGSRTPIVPHERLPLPDGKSSPSTPIEQALRLAPICRGHRMLLHAPAPWPAAPWLSDCADAIRRGDPGAQITACLLEQPPEQLAAAKLRARGGGKSGGETAGWQCLGSHFGDEPERTTAIANMALHRAMRHVETHSGHAVLLLDSLTTWTIALGRTRAPSGAWIQPGLDARTVLPGKQLLASACAFAEGGSLTVIARVVTDAEDSRSEPRSLIGAIAHEFRHHSNADIVLDPALLAAGASSPLDPSATRTRRECLIETDEQRAVREALLAEARERHDK